MTRFEKILILLPVSTGLGLARTLDTAILGTVRDPSVRLSGDPFSERLDQSRLADPGLPGEKHRLTLAALGEVPALEEKSQFLLTRNERAQARCVECLEAALRCARAGDPPSLDRLSEAP